MTPALILAWVLLLSQVCLVSALVLALMLGRNIWLNSHGGKH